MTNRPLELSRSQILAFRRGVGALDERLESGPISLHRAAWAGMQDSMPRGALLSIHARVERTAPGAWQDPSLAQLWGPRFSAYVVAERDFGVFSLGRLPENPAKRQRAEVLARRVQTVLGSRVAAYGEVGRSLGVNPNMLRYAAPTGTIRIRWDGARQPSIWCVAPPEIDPRDARLELVRRYLHIFGPATPDSFAQWAGLTRTQARQAVAALEGELVDVRTPIGEALILESDAAGFRASPGPTAGARLLPSGDAYYLLWGRHRELLVPDATRRNELWTSRVWPGAMVVSGEVAGTWRRTKGTVIVSPWRALSAAERNAIDAEAQVLPIPDHAGRIDLRWDG